MDMRSFSLNLEISVMVRGASFVNALRTPGGLYRAGVRELPRGVDGPAAADQGAGQSRRAHLSRAVTPSARQTGRHRTAVTG